MFLRNMRNLVLVMAPVMLFVFVYSNFIQKPKHDPVAYVGQGDPRMAAARAEARASLPTFLARLQSPAPGEDGCWRVRLALQFSHWRLVYPAVASSAKAISRKLKP